jgi:hypothetical protein
MRWTDNVPIAGSTQIVMVLSGFACRQYIEDKRRRVNKRLCPGRRRCGRLISSWKNGVRVTRTENILSPWFAVYQQVQRWLVAGIFGCQRPFRQELHARRLYALESFSCTLSGKDKILQHQLLGRILEPLGL